jgi:hypothetical protein
MGALGNALKMVCRRELKMGQTISPPTTTMATAEKIIVKMHVYGHLIQDRDMTIEQYEREVEYLIKMNSKE